MSKATKIFIIAIICIMILIVVGLTIFISAKNTADFTTAKWEKIENREKIVDSLLNKYNLIGMTKDEVKELLGDSGYAYEANYWSYNMTYSPPGVMLFTIKCLDVFFENDVVTNYEIRNH